MTHISIENFSHMLLDCLPRFVMGVKGMGVKGNINTAFLHLHIIYIFFHFIQ